MDPITIAIIGLIAARVVGMGATDVAYAVRGKDSPRWEARKAAIKASAQTGRPVRYGFGGYMADMVDDAWVSARERRERKLAGQVGQVAAKSKPMRSYLGRVWGHRWDDAGLKHDRKHRDRQIKKGLIDPDTPTSGIDDAFDTAPRDQQAASPFATEGDPRASAGDPFTPDDLRRYGQWVKQQLDPKHHEAVDEWVTHESHNARNYRATFTDNRFTELANVGRSLESWLNRTHPYVVAQDRVQDLVDKAMDEPVSDTNSTDTEEETIPEPTPPRSSQPTAIMPEDVGLAPLVDYATIIEKANNAAGNEREQVLRDAAKQQAIGQLMELALSIPRTQEQARQLREANPDTWQTQMEQVLRDKARNDSDFDGWVEDYYRSLKNEADKSFTKPKDTATAGMPASNVVSLNDFINNRKDTNTVTTTANAEAIGLDDAITYAEQSTQHHTDTASALELFKISLAQGGCGQGTLGIVDEIDDANTVIQGLYQRLHESLVADKVTVGDAYNARPDAGTKEFVTN